jgi:hypothetical protein
MIYFMSFISNNIQFCVIISTRIKSGTFSQHSMIVVKYTQKKGKPNFIIIRIEVKVD